MQKAVIILGLVIVAIGLAWPWLKGLPIGQLPGDFVFGGDNFKVYFPLTTMLLTSAILSLLFWFFR